MMLRHVLVVFFVFTSIAWSAEVDPETPYESFSYQDFSLIAGYGQFIDESLAWFKQHTVVAGVRYSGLSRLDQEWVLGWSTHAQFTPSTNRYAYVGFGGAFYAVASVYRSIKPWLNIGAGFQLDSRMLFVPDWDESHGYWWTNHALVLAVSTQKTLPKVQISGNVDVSLLSFHSQSPQRRLYNNDIPTLPELVSLMHSDPSFGHIGNTASVNFRMSVLRNRPKMKHGLEAWLTWIRNETSSSIRGITYGTGYVIRW